VEWMPVLISALTLLNIGQLVLAAYNRRQVVKDREHQTHETNQDSQIKAGLGYHHSLIKRVELLEGQVASLQQSLTEQMVTNERLKAENARLKDLTERQEKELQQLREKEKELTERIDSLERLIEELRG